MCRVAYSNRQREFPIRIDKTSLKTVVEVVLQEELQDADIVGLYLLSDRMMRYYHKKFFNDPSSTDCMSFPLDDQTTKKRHLGEIMICPKTAHLVAQKENISFWKELTLNLVHGMLHLLGYEDTTETGYTMMTQKQTFLLSSLEQNQCLIRGFLL